VRIGIGLPNMVPGTSGRRIVQWAADAEAAGFASLSSVDRIVFDNYDTFVALAVAAAVTERIRLNTAVLLGPVRPAGLLAKAAASIDRLSEGRFDLGLGVGNRPDDYEAGGADFHHRGRILDAQIEEMLSIWAGASRGTAGRIGPTPHTPGGPPLLFGGTSAATWNRVALYGTGWIGGLGDPDDFASMSEQLDNAWDTAGREGKPRRLMLRYFALGADASSHVAAFMDSYYAYAPFKASLVSGTGTSEKQLCEIADSYAAVGCEEMLLFPCSSGRDQVGLLAEALGNYL
jgi:alkanesulfonate monooxygenase SsuD/methylene tetrahydromethanopterin reductase-like flavin-dependent oxidoreductase (luciferase family)